MFIENFTDEARGSIKVANKIALDFNSKRLEPDHLFLGIVSNNLSQAYRNLGKMWINVEELKDLVTKKMVRGEEEVCDVSFSKSTKSILQNSIKFINKHGIEKLSTGIILFQIVFLDVGIAAKYLKEQGIIDEDMKSEILLTVDKTNKTTTDKQITTPELDKYSIDLTKKARDNNLDPVVCRDREIDRLIRIICRRTKNNPVLLGEPGVGKTAIVEGFVQKIIDGDVPKNISNSRVVSLDLGLLIAGTKWRGQFEERLKKVLNEILNDKTIILFIDEVHTIVGAGSSERSLDAANLLKPSLSRGEIQCIGATTLKEYKLKIEKDGALERRFQSIKVDPLNIEDTVKVLNVLKHKYETFHGVNFNEGTLKLAADLSDRYISDRFLPDKAIDIMDEAAASASMKTIDYKHYNNSILKIGEEIKTSAGNTEKIIELRNQIRDIKKSYNRDHVTKDDILKVIFICTGIPVQDMDENENHRIKHIEENLNKMVIGQSAAIDVIGRAIKRSRIGISNPRRPIGSFIFLGPSGVGKTELVKCLAEYMFGSRDAIIQLDMSEYGEKFSTSRLIGSPPGYVGHENGSLLTEKVRQKPFSLILLDELEKAHPDVVNVLLQILEEGCLTDGQGRTVNFKNTIIIMTSNIGSEASVGKNGLGFIKNSDDREKIKKIINDEVSKAFPIEFINRLDDTIIFKTLDKTDLKKIIELQITKLNKKLEPKKLIVELELSAVDWVLSHGYNIKFGARFLDRCIKKNIEDVISDGLINRDITEGDDLIFSCNDDQLVMNIGVFASV